jgi:hypothetical protein
MSLVLAGDGVSVNPFNGRPAWLTLGGFWIIKQNIFFLKFRNPSVSRSYLEIDGVRKEKERLTAVTHTTNPTILSSLGESWILDEWLVVGGVEGGNDDRNDDWNGARQRQLTTSPSIPKEIAGESCRGGGGG